MTGLNLGGGSFRRSGSLLITYCFEDKVSWQVDNWSRALNQEDRSFSRSEVGIYKRKQESKKQENKNSTKKVIKKKRKFFLFFLVEFLFSCFLDRFLGRVLVFLFS